MARYLFVNRYFHPDTSATSQLLSDLAFSLAAAGGSVTVVASRDRYCDRGAALPARETVSGVQVVRVWTTRFGRKHMLGRAIDYASFYASAMVALLRHLSRGQVVIAKTDPPLISVVVAMCAWIRGAVQVNWLQDLFPEVGSRLAVPGMRLLEGPLVSLRDRSLRMARLNVVLGERMRELLLARGIPDAQIHVIANWAEGNVHPVPHAGNALRLEWKFDGSHFVVGYSGNMGRAHDMETIVAAAVRLRLHPRIRFLFVGDGAKRALVENAVAEHCLGNVVVRGYQHREALAHSLSVADVHLVSLLPELEGLIVPCKVYGVMAAGRAVVNIGAADGEVAQLLAASGAGTTCAVGDVDTLCVTLERLCAGGAAEMGCAAREHSVQHLHRDIALRHWARCLAAVGHAHAVDGELLDVMPAAEALGGVVPH